MGNRKKIIDKNMLRHYNNAISNLRLWETLKEI